MKNLPFMICLIFMACSSDNEDDLTTAPPMGETITYNQHVRPIINSNCVSCHSDPPTNGATIPLTEYNFVKNAVLNRQLIARIKSQQPGFRMPPGGPSLPANLIDIIEQWEADGLLEN